jgi:hypothetical protein
MKNNSLNSHGGKNAAKKNDKTKTVELSSLERN